MRDLAGKTAVVTGAASGIGRALASQLAREGMQVIGADIEVQEASDSSIEAVALDVTDAAACAELAQTLFDRFGAVHLLVNNAGVIGRFAPVWDQDPDDWDWILSVNVRGVANMLRAFVPKMRAAGEPAHIVNTASEAAFTSRAYVSAYHASKHAVLAMTEAMAQELDFEAVPIRVSVLCPGGVNTRVLDAARNRPPGLDPVRPSEGPAAALRASYETMLPNAMSPEDVAGVVVDGIKNDRFYLLSHPEVARLPRMRADAVDADEYPRVPERLAARLVDDESR